MYRLSPICFYSFVLVLRFVRSELPKFTFEPSSRIVDAGSKVVLDCSAEPVTAHVRWKHNGRFIYPETELGVEILPNKLVIRQFRPIRPYPHEEVYQCVATTMVGSIASKPARISSSPTDLFPEDDSYVNVTEGNVAVIPCAPNVHLPNVDIWVEFNDELIKFNKDRYILMPSGNLQIVSSRLIDSGVYRCIAYNTDTGKSISAKSAIYVSVRVPSAMSPVIVLPPKDKSEVRLNSNLTLECAAGGYPNPKIIWSKYGGHLPKGRYHQVLGNLVITEIQNSDQGTFICQAENSGGMGQVAVAIVEVRDAPVIIKPPESKRVREGEPVQFECQVHGRPKPSIVWLHNGQQLGSRGGTTSEDSQLTMAQAKPNHAGIYQCIASNQLGSVYAVTMLEVEPHPVASTVAPPPGIVADSLVSHSRQVFTMRPQNQTIQVGMMAIMTCVMDYSTNPLITWHKDNQPLAGNSRFHKASSGSLQIFNAQLSDSGLYTCMAFNSNGHATASAYLEVVEPTFSNPLNEDSMKNTNHTNHIFDHSHMTSLNMKSVDEDNIEIQYDKKKFNKKNNKKPKNKTKEKDAATKMIPPGKPLVTQRSENSVTLTWDVPENQGLAITLFKVQYKEISKPNARWMTNDDDILPNQRTYELASLKPGQTYRFRMVAIYMNQDNRHGPNSKKFTLKEGFPMQGITNVPHITDAVPVGSSAINVFWEYVETVMEHIDRFRIYYKSADGKEGWKETEAIVPEARQFIITYLLPNTRYQIKMKAFSSAGSSPDSDIYNVETNNSSMVNDSDPLSTNDQPRESSPNPEHGFTSNNELLYMVLGIVLGTMVLLLTIFMIICGWKQRRQRLHLSIDPSIRDKYEDPAHRINMEQTSTLKIIPPVNGVQVMPTAQNGHIPHKQPKINVSVNPMSKYDGEDHEKLPLHQMNGGFKEIISPNHIGDTNFNNLETNKNTTTNIILANQAETNSINNSKNRSSSTSPHSVSPVSPSSELTPPSPGYQQMPHSGITTPESKTPQSEQVSDVFESTTEQEETPGSVSPTAEHPASPPPDYPLTPPNTFPDA